MSHTPPPLTLDEVERRLGPERWAKRVASADAEATRMAEVIERIEAGESRTKALEAVFPDRTVRSMYARLRQYQEKGRDGLINRVAPLPPTKLTPEIRTAIQLLASHDPSLYSKDLSKILKERLEVQVSPSRIRELLKELGLERKRGRPKGSGSHADNEPAPAVSVTRVPFAGAELLIGVERQIGAVLDLSRQIGHHLESLPEVADEPVDDTGNRDERGRFLPSYNEAPTRTEPDLGGRFDSVERRRAEKDLRSMRTAEASESSRYRKDLSLTLLPMLVETARWSSLTHWQGAGLGPLVGVSYMPATLDKHTRELKLAGAACTMREAVAGYWLELEEAAGGLAVVYIDGSTKPHWTSMPTLCTKVTATGKVMPGSTTVWLNSGSGTPLAYREFRGTASVPKQVMTLLAQVEEVTGPGTTRRLVVLDRESHSVALFKELDAAQWKFVVPLRSVVTKSAERFESQGPWQPYGEDGGEVCEGRLSLNDRRQGEKPWGCRVVGRRRKPDGKVAWYATNATAEELSASEAMDTYFQRWPLQEHVFRDANGRVGLKTNYGFGRKRVVDVAIVNDIDRVGQSLEHCRAEVSASELELTRLRAELQDVQMAETNCREMKTFEQDEMMRLAQTANVAAEALAAQAHKAFHRQTWVDEMRDAQDVLRRKIEALEANIRKELAREIKLERQRQRLELKTRVFTVDTELDEIMLAYKMTFINLATRLMRDHLVERMELDTLIRAVLTLPGEKQTTPDEVLTRIYRHDRDPRAMAAVERACASLNALNLRTLPDANGVTQLLRYELVAHPDIPPREDGSDS